MRQIVAAMLIFFASPAVAGSLAPAAGGFGGALPDAQLKWLCVRAMQSYLDGKGPPPPAMCESATAPQATYQAPPVTRCMWIGNVYQCRTQ